MAWASPSLLVAGSTQAHDASLRAGTCRDLCTWPTPTFPRSIGDENGRPFAARGNAIQRIHPKSEGFGK